MLSKRGSSQCSDRSGCSSRLSSMKFGQTDSPGKPRYARAPFRSTSCKAVAGSTSKAIFRNSPLEHRSQSFLIETDIAESSKRQAKNEYAESNNNQAPIEDLSSDGLQGDTKDSLSTAKDTVTQIVLPDSRIRNSIHKVEGKGPASSSKPHMQTSKQSSLHSLDSNATPSVPRSSTSSHSSLVPKPSQGLCAGAHRCGIKNLSCTTVSDTVLLGCSSSECRSNKRVDARRKKLSDGESSSAFKCTSGLSNRECSCPTHTNLPGPSVPVSEHSLVQHSARRIRNNSTCTDSAVSVRTRRAFSGESRIRLSEERDDGNFSLHDPIGRVPRLRQTRYSVQEAVPESLSRSFLTEPQQSFHLAGYPGSSSPATQSRSTPHPEESSSQIFNDTFRARDGYRHINMEAIEQVLLALERIGQDGELTYEVVDVELIALEEKIGTVSTALSDKELAKCLKRSIYMQVSPVTGTGDIVDDIKCSICQDEYVDGDEVGKLACEHQYHVTCIHQWLRQKNWCPVCKAS
ncbi:uncharacterized protein [Typha latifolia]|uniref:uncharacterized protein n=1 Tax=Typha latifolia TaxID=4733 RepID=UPI003C2E24F8